MKELIRKVLLCIGLVLFLFSFNVQKINAYSKEDILNVFNKVETCSQETTQILTGVKATYTRMLNERNITKDNLDKIYNNINKVIKILNTNNLCSIDQENKINEEIKKELYNLYMKTNDIILSSPKLSGEDKTNSNVIIDTTNKQIGIYENGVLADVIELEEKLNYVGLNKLVIIGIVLMSVLLIVTIIIKFIKKEKFITTTIIYVLMLLLPCTFICREKISLVLDMVSLMSVDSKEGSKQLLVDNEKIISYPAYGEKYAELTIDNESENIYFGDTPNILKKGIGQSSSSYLPGENKRTILSGHNTGLLKKLMNIKKGNELLIETVYGNFKYKVENIEIVQDTETSVLRKDYDLILYTCYPNTKIYGDKRIVVYSNLVESNWLGDNHEK